jgi:hypothetical protein
VQRVGCLFRRPSSQTTGSVGGLAFPDGLASTRGAFSPLAAAPRGLGIRSVLLAWPSSRQCALRAVLVDSAGSGLSLGGALWSLALRFPPYGGNEPSVPSFLLPCCPVGLSLPAVAKAFPSVPLRFPAPRASASDPLPLDTRLLGGLLPLLLLLHVASVSRLLGGLLLLWLLLLTISESGLAYPVGLLVDCVLWGCPRWFCWPWPTLGGRLAGKNAAPSPRHRGRA